MLNLYDKNTTDFSKSGKYIIGNATNVLKYREINGEYYITFDLPINDVALKFITLFDYIKSGNQLYIVRSIEKIKTNNPIVKIKALHVVSELNNIHIQYFPEQIGVAVDSMIKTAINGSKFTYLTDAEADALGLTLIKDETDLLGTYDKVSAIEIVKKIIETLQRGELYTNNYKIALVERLGKNNGVILETNHNLTNITRFDDTSELMNKIFVYGNGDISTATGYIESAESIALYGERVGYVNFSDVDDLDELQNKSLWLINENNPDRIDMPTTTITCGVIDLHKLGIQQKIEIGDTVRIFDRNLGVNQLLRCVKIEEYPFQPTNGTFTFGAAPLTYSQLLTKLELNKENLQKYSNTDGKIQTSGLDMLAPSISAANNKVWNSSFEIYDEYAAAKYWVGGHVSNLDSRFDGSSMLLVAAEQTTQDIIAKIDVDDFVISNSILLAFYHKGGKVRLEIVDDDDNIIPLWSPKTGTQDLYVESNFNGDWQAAYTFALVDKTTLKALGKQSFRIRLTNMDSVNAWIDGVICQSKYVNNYVLYYDGPHSNANEWGDEIGSITPMIPVEANQESDKTINGKTEICRITIESTEQTDAIVSASCEVENTEPQIYRFAMEDNATEIFYHRKKIDEFDVYSITRKTNGLHLLPGTHVFQFFVDGTNGTVRSGNITMILKGIKAVALAQNPVLSMIEVIVGKWGLVETDFPTVGFYGNVVDDVEVINTLVEE